MAYPLAPLMMIREKRYDKALTNQSQRKQLLYLAVQKTAQAEKKLHDYKEWKEQEIERRYAEVFNKQLSMGELEEFFHSLTSLDLQQFELEKQLQQAQKEEESAKQALKEAQDQVKAAHTALFKLQKQKEIWEFEQHQILEYKADQELEDFKSKTPKY